MFTEHYWDKCNEQQIPLSPDLVQTIIHKYDFPVQAMTSLVRRGEWQQRTLVREATGIPATWWLIVGERKDLSVSETNKANCCYKDVLYISILYEIPLIRTSIACIPTNETLTSTATWSRSLNLHGSHHQSLNSPEIIIKHVLFSLMQQPTRLPRG